MPVITVINPKGGVGKTTVTLGLAGAFSSAYPDTVRIADADAEGGATAIIEAGEGWDGIAVEATNVARLRKLAADETEVVVVDTPGEWGPVTQAAVEAADLVVAVVEPAVLAVNGLASLASSLRGVTDAWVVVVNGFDARKGEHVRQLAALTEVLGERLVLPPVPSRAAVETAQGRCVPIQALSTRGAYDVTDALYAIAVELIRRLP